MLIIKLAVPAVAAVAIAAPAGGQETPTAAPLAPTVVQIDRIYPKRRVVRSTAFTPLARPTVSQVQAIITMEAARVGASASHLRSRIACESGMRWYAANGQYAGLGQFAQETFTRGMRSIGSRLVQWTTRRVRHKHVTLIDTYSDGSVVKRKGWIRRQTVVHHYRGVIPRNPVRTHGHAQVRIMAMAMVGRGAVNDSEWECR